jgi:CHASE1-domain containing sensor protein
MASGVLFAMAVLLNQTRSIWLASLSALPVLILVFRQSERTSRTLRLALMAVVISIGVFVAMRYVTPRWILH